MQRRVLIRTRGLASFRRALVELALAGDPLEARRRVIVVPTRAAGALLRSTIEQHAVDTGRQGLLCPDLLTREECLARLHTAVPGAPRWLTRVERETILGRAARDTLDRRRSLPAPFDLRPGLIGAMLEFYDELRRRQRRVRSFARTVFDELRVERGVDRGSESLIDQTRFLGLTFLAYERMVRRSGGVDEHELVRVLLETQPVLPFDDLVVAVADHPADPRGLWPVDFDLIGRLRQLSAVRVVMTDEAHDAGFRARVEQELPGIEEMRAPDVERSPVLVSLTGDVSKDIDVPVAVSRDREEELRNVARHIRARAASNDHVLPGATAVVFHRPLPYLYVAQQVMADARVPYQVADALPLAAEPYAALLDLAMTVSRTDGARDACLALLRSRLVVFAVDGQDVSMRDVTALETILTDRRAGGTADTFVREVDAWALGKAGRASSTADAARRAARAADASTTELRALRSAPASSAQIRALSGFLRVHEQRDNEIGPEHDRYRRARAGVLAVLDDLADAFERHDDRPRDHDEFAATVYHAIEVRTFAPVRGQSGVHLVDAAAARFGEFDDVFLVGLVETDWAERPRRSFFYAASLLKALGWPQAADQTQAQQAAFRDVLTLARLRTRLSAFELDGDAAVALSTMIDAARVVPTIHEALDTTAPVFADEILTRPVDPEGLEPPADVWFAWRRRRPDLERADYGGLVPPREPAQYLVSRVDRYVTCPFKYFAEQVLRLPEERPDATGLTPLERGTFLHLLLERFYRRWDDEKGGAITAANMPDALALFTSIADEMIADLPEADRIVERMRIVGSMVSPGIAERVFEVEASDPVGVVDRLLEVPIEGSFRFPVRSGLSERLIAVKGKADRVDVLDDGSLRVVDYKLGRMPDIASSIQVGVYAHCVQQTMEAREGSASHPVSGAMYLAFGDDRRFDGRLAGKSADTGYAVHARANQFADAVERIESGEFPPRPRHPSECQWCAFAGVCRKEYRVEEAADESTESV